MRRRGDTREVGRAPIRRYAAGGECCYGCRRLLRFDIDLSSFVPSLVQWSDDLVLREPAPAVSAIKENIESAMGEVAMLSSINQDLFKLKRSDPLDQWQVYLKKTQSLASTDFKREKGFLVDPATKRIIIPIQFSAQPKMSNVLETLEILKKYPTVTLVGAHASAYMNEKQVHEDMQVVSVVGVVVLIELSILCVRVCYIIPIVHIKP